MWMLSHKSELPRNSVVSARLKRARSSPWGQREASSGLQLGNGEEVGVEGSVLCGWGFRG